VVEIRRKVVKDEGDVQSERKDEKKWESERKAKCKKEDRLEGLNRRGLTNLSRRSAGSRGDEDGSDDDTEESDTGGKKVLLG